MNPVRVDFAARNNAPWQDAIVLQLDGAAFDFGDYLPLQMVVRATQFTPAADLDVTNSDHLTVEPDGALGINVPETLLAPLLGTYYYDLRGTEAGDKIVLMYGMLTVTQGLTRS